MSFEKWLVKFKKEQTPVGDLSRDFISSKCKTIESSFKKFPPCNDSYDALIIAQKTYMLELASSLRKLLSRITDDYEYLLDKEFNKRINDLISQLKIAEKVLIKNLNE